MSRKLFSHLYYSSFKSGDKLTPEQRKKRKKRRKIVFWTVVLLLVCAFIVRLYIDNHCLELSSHTVDIDDFDGEFRIALISDLHNRQFGKDNKNIVEMIEQQKPDIICCVGDMFDENSENSDILVSLSNDLLKIAPTYYSLGNHEFFMKDTNKRDNVLDDVKNTGVKLLDNEYVDIDINGNTVRLGGIYDYMQMLNYTEETGKGTVMYEFFRDFRDTSLPTVLMCHLSEGFVCYGGIYDWDIDLELCGHSHGGLIQIPFFNVSAYVPYQGKFAKYYDGYYHINNEDVVITSGFTGYKYIPRLFNRPEVTIVDVQ